MRPRTRTALTAMYAGAALTALATVFPFVGRSVLADHIQSGYPDYDAIAIGTAVTAYLAILATAGVLGLLGWLGTILAVRSGKGWAPVLGTGMLVAAICFALAALTIRDTSGDVGLAPLFGWLFVLPCVPGLAAVALSRRTG